MSNNPKPSETAVLLEGGVIDKKKRKAVERHLPETGLSKSFFLLFFSFFISYLLLTLLCRRR
jgi:preprotein translocase subunit SecG